MARTTLPGYHCFTASLYTRCSRSQRAVGCVSGLIGTLLGDVALVQRHLHLGPFVFLAPGHNLLQYVAAGRAASVELKFVFFCSDVDAD